MEQHRLVHEITRIAAPVVRSLGLAIWGIERIPSGRTVLRIYVDTPSGARDVSAERPDAEEAARPADGRGPSIDQCAKISRHIGLALEAEDIVPHAYVLEVSSPGLERPFFALAQLAPYIGGDVAVKLGSAQPELPDRKCLRGRLQAVGEQAFTLL
ncbi:MAG: ribosome maturation factor RimP, partial [Desulfovibrionaceae bacterium]|nr:ribosome maturation factor RimP [Desulfovibrionaceae bacterium]